MIAIQDCTKIKFIAKSIGVLHNYSWDYSSSPITNCVWLQTTGSINESSHSPLPFCFLSPSLSPDDLSSVSLSWSLGIDWDLTGESRVEINKEPVAMNTSLTHPNMKGGIIICQAWKRGREFLSILSHKWLLLLPLPHGVPKHFNKYTFALRYYDCSSYVFWHIEQNLSFLLKIS